MSFPDNKYLDEFWIVVAVAETGISDGLCGGRNSKWVGWVVSSTEGRVGATGFVVGAEPEQIW